MSVQRTPPKNSGKDGQDDTFRDLSASINVPKASQRKNPSKTVSSEINKGVFTGTRSKNTSDKLPPPPLPPTNQQISPNRSNNDSMLSLPQVTEQIFLNLDIPPQINLPTQSIEVSRQDVLNSSDLNLSNPQVANVSGLQNFNFSNSRNTLNPNVSTNSINNVPKPPKNSHQNNYSVPCSPDYKNLVEDLITAVQEANKVQLANEIDQRVKETVQSCFKELLKDYQIVPRVPHQSNQLITNPSSSDSRTTNPVSDFVREFRQRLALGDSRNNFDTNRQIPNRSDAFSNPQDPNSARNSERIYPGEERRVDFQYPVEYYDRKPVRIDQWDVKFDGRRNGAITVEEFVFRIEYLQIHYKCPWNIIVRDIHTLLRENAKEWYWMFIRNNKDARWDDLREALLLQYQSTTSDLDVIRDIVERKQLPTESVDSYFHELSKLRSKLDKSYPETSLIRIIKRNLRDSISRIVYPMSIYSIDQLRHECFQIEQNFPRRDRVPPPINRFPNGRVQQVHEIEEQGVDDDFVQVDEARYVRPNKNTAVGAKIVCYNCREPGHIFMNCPEDPKIFCYRCGLPGFKTINCPDCRKGNLMKTVTTPGESRSTAPSLETKPRAIQENPFQ